MRCVAESFNALAPVELRLGSQILACVVQPANMGQQLAIGNSSWCPELESLDRNAPSTLCTHHSSSLSGDTIVSLTAAGGIAHGGLQLQAMHSP